MSEPAGGERSADDNDAWLEQLRAAVDRPPTEEGRARRWAPVPVRRPASGPDNGTGPRTGEEPVDLRALRDALRAVEDRLAAIEAAIEDLARAVRRVGLGPELVDFEKLISRVLRAELPAILPDHAVGEQHPPDQQP